MRRCTCCPDATAPDRLWHDAYRRWHDHRAAGHRVRAAAWGWVADMIAAVIWR